MKTFDEAIQNAKKMAEWMELFPNDETCCRIAENQRQLIEWLKELIEQRKRWNKLIKEIQELKRRCNNPTCHEAYETGYYSALSFVEQIISKLKVEK